MLAAPLVVVCAVPHIAAMAWESQIGYASHACALGPGIATRWPPA